MDRQLRHLPNRQFANGNPKINYPDRWLIPFLAPAVGYLMVQIGENRPWPLWSSDPKVLASILSSVLCTAVVLLAVAFGNRWLDQELPWRKNTLGRVVAQALVCIFPPALLVAGWQYLFFYYMGAIHHMDGYLRDDFSTALSLLLIWNTIYPTCYYYSVPRDEQPDAQEPEAQEPEAQAPETAEPETDLATSEDIPDPANYWFERVGLLATEEKVTWAHHFDGTVRGLDRPLQYYADWLVGPNFHMARRGYLVNYNAIDRVIEEDRYFTLILKPLSQTSPKAINTRMDHKREFISWWKGEIERKAK